MATHRTHPKKTEEVTAVQIRLGITHGSGLTPGDYIVTHGSGEQYVMPKDEFEAEFEEIPEPTLTPLNPNFWAGMQGSDITSR